MRTLLKVNCVKKCSNIQNMLQSHIRVKLTGLSNLDCFMG